MRKPVLLTVAHGLLFVVSSSAQDGGDSLFQPRCAPCHGVVGEGKCNLGSPLKGIDVKLGRLTQPVTKGWSPGPHSNALPNLSEARSQLHCLLSQSSSTLRTTQGNIGKGNQVT